MKEQSLDILIKLFPNHWLEIYWAWQTIKWIPLRIDHKVMEGFLLLFSAKHVTPYHIFLNDGSYFIRWKLIGTDENWFENSESDRKAYFGSIEQK